MSAKSSTSGLAELAGGDDKMGKIVDEMDRFFKSVHADIEDWKFSMEDYGDGTRIFVRFQIHINGSGVPSRPAPSVAAPTGSVEVTSPAPSPVPPGGRTLPDGRAVTEDLPRAAGPAVTADPGQADGRAVTEDLLKPDPTGAARRDDLDMASFVDVWRHQRDTNSNLGGEYHKEGAPFVDAASEWKGHKRSDEDSPPQVPGESGDEASKNLDGHP